MPSRVARKSDPKLWASSKARACSVAGLCDHSARKMQWAVRDYKKRGGRFTGAKTASNSLARWTRQRWRTHSGEKSGGRRRYLPDAAWKRLSASQVRRTNAAKRRGFSKGKQWVKQPADVVARLSKRASR